MPRSAHAVPLVLLAAVLGLLAVLIQPSPARAAFAETRVGASASFAASRVGIATADTRALQPGNSATYDEVASGDLFAADASSTAGQTLFHYTSEAGSQSIRDSGLLNASLEGGADARFGSGQYLTDIAPDSGLTPGQIARRLWGQPWAGSKMQAWIKVNVDGLNVENPLPGIFRIPGNDALDISQRIVDWGSMP